MQPWQPTAESGSTKVKRWATPGQAAHVLATLWAAPQQQQPSSAARRERRSSQHLRWCRLDQTDEEGDSLMINIGGSTPLPASRLHELVAAIVHADSEDECDWAEWKSDLDLDNRHGQFTLAKAILGFANRNPHNCTQPFAGTAYVIVGAEPGHARGIKRIDLSELQPKLARYLGSPGPFWRHYYVPLPDDNDRSVLVIEVPAPRPGETGYPLAHEGIEGVPKAASAPSGTLFTRRGSKTERANYNEVTMLFDRADQSTAVTKITDLGLKTYLISDDHLRVLDVSPAAIENWLERRRQHLLKTTQDDALRAVGLTRLWSDHEIRLYSRSVDAYLEKCRRYVEGALTAAFLRQGYNGFTIHVDNPSDEHLIDVEVTLILPSNCIVIDPGQLQLARFPEPQLVQLSGFGVSATPQANDSVVTSDRSSIEPRHAKISASKRSIHVREYVTYTEGLGTIRAQDSAHTCTIQILILDGAPTELEIKINVTSAAVPGKLAVQSTISPAMTNQDFLVGLIDPDPRVPDVQTRKFPVIHNHHTH
jgi:hypothetical protein